MSIWRQKRFATFIVLLVFMIVGCRQQSSIPQSSPSPASAEAGAPATAAASANNTPATSSNASAQNKPAVDACKLLTADEIKTVQSDTLKGVTPSPASAVPFITSQCFYATNDFVNSVSLTVTEQSSAAGAQNLREFWRERFGSAEKEREREGERDRDRDKKARSGEEEEESAPPERVKGIGEEAYAAGNAKIGALYVLKGDKFLRISVGGSHSQPERLAKMKRLAQYAISRL